MKLNRFLILMMMLFGTTSLFAGFGSMNVSSSTHDTTSQSKETSITLSWAAPTTDGGTVLDGYYYKLDKNSSTLMDTGDTVLADSATSKISTASDGDGSYYFHIAAFATNGDIGATKHFGPIKIDETAPSTPSISPDGGSYNASQSVTMSATDANNYTIYYTTNGDEPTSGSTTYSSAITVASSKTVKAIAIDSAGNESGVKSSSFVINTTSNVAQFGNEVTAGNTIATNNNGRAISFTSSISIIGASVTHYKYKVDSETYSVTPIDKATNIDISGLSDGQHTLSLIGHDGSSWQSEANPTTLTFTVDNTAPIAIAFSAATGETINSDTTITISSTGSDEIYYTIDGVTIPSESSINGTTLALTSTNNGTVTVKAIAYDTTGNKTEVAQAEYTVDIPLDAPAISPNGGSYPNSKSISMSATTGTIYYTTDGSIPDNGSSVYGGAFPITSTKTIKAIAIDGAYESSVATATVTIYTPTPPPPAPTISAVFGDEVSAGSIIATVADNSDTYKTSISVSGTNISHYKYKVDSGSYGSQTVKATGIDISALVDGEHTLYLLGSNGSSWQSSARTLTFTVDNTVPTALEIVREEESVSMSADDANLYAIHYTTDGSTPTADSDIYDSVISVDSTKALKAIAIDIAGNKSGIVENIPEVVEPPLNVKSDFDGNSVPDIFWRHSDGRMYLRTLNADGTKNSVTYVGTVPNVYEIQDLQDFNGDGIPDIVWRHAETGALYLRTLNADGTKNSVTYMGTVPTAYEVQDLQDFDRDGVPDIVWRHADTGAMYLRTLNENGTKKVVTYMGTVRTAYTIKGLKDFDGDGVSDIVWRHVDTGEMYLRTLNENGTKKAVTYMGTVRNAYVIKALIDFNSDNIPDIVWRHKDTGAMYLRTLNADGTKRVVTYMGVISVDFTIESIEDFDGDNVPDMVLRDKTSGEMYLRTLNTDGTKKAVSYMGTVSTSYTANGLN